MGTAIEHRVPNRIFDIWALWRSVLASECPDVKIYKWRLNPVWCRMLYSCPHMAAVGIKGTFRFVMLHDVDLLQKLPPAESQPVSSRVVQWTIVCLVIILADVVTTLGNRLSPDYQQCNGSDDCMSNTTGIVWRLFSMLIIRLQTNGANIAINAINN